MSLSISGCGAESETTHTTSSQVSEVCSQHDDLQSSFFSLYFFQQCSLVSETLQHIKGSFLPQDVVTHEVLPYIDSFLFHYTIEIGNTTAYEIYKGMYYEEIQSDQVSTQSRCDLVCIDLRQEYQRRSFDEEDDIYYRYSFRTGRIVKIVPKGYRGGDIISHFRQVSKNLYPSDSYDYFIFQLMDNTTRVRYNMRTNHYHWWCFIESDTQEEFESLSTTTFTIEILDTRTNTVIDTILY